jgi:N-acetylglucosamine kinase-like BadF-type ATPase
VTTALGVDGGGRKTYAIVVDALGTMLGAAAGGPSNWELVGVDGARDTIAGAADQALAEAGVERSALDASVFGLAGVDWPSDVERLEGVIGPLGLGGARRILNDAFVALRAGTAQPWGICVIAGTGTVTAGRDPAGAEFRTIGEGAIFGDFGDEFDVSELAVRAVADQYTGRGPSTILADMLCEHLGADSVPAMIERLCREDPRIRSPEVQILTPLVLEATEQGDLVAREILERIGQALGSAAGLVARRLQMGDLEFDVVCAGNLFRTPNRYLLDQLELEARREAPNAQLTLLDVPPVVGAALMALELAGPAIGVGAKPRLSSAALKRFWGGEASA